MPFTIEIPRTAVDTTRQGAIVSDRRLYLTDDRETIVEAGDPRAAWLLCAAGHLIPSSDVTRLSLLIVDGKVTQPRSDDAPSDDASSGGDPSPDEGPEDLGAPDELKDRVPDENKIRRTRERK